MYVTPSVAFAGTSDWSLSEGGFYDDCNIVDAGSPACVAVRFP